MSDSPTRTFPEFSLVRLLRTVFEPKPGERIAILIDLADPRQITGFAFLKDAALTIQRHAHDVFYQGLKNGVMAELGLVGGDMFAYQITGGSNLDLPDAAWAPDGRQVSLAKDVYPRFDILLCISTFSATAPLTAFAKRFGFRGATLHGLNPIILRTGLAVDYNEVSRQAERLRLAMTRADAFEARLRGVGPKGDLEALVQPAGGAEEPRPVPRRAARRGESCRRAKSILCRPAQKGSSPCATRTAAWG